MGHAHQRELSLGLRHTAQVNTSETKVSLQIAEDRFDALGAPFEPLFALSALTDGKHLFGQMLLAVSTDMAKRLCIFRMSEALCSQGTILAMGSFIYPKQTTPLPPFIPEL